MNEIVLLIVIVVFFWLGFRLSWRIFNWFISLETAAQTSAFAYYIKRLFVSLVVGFITAYIGFELTISLIKPDTVSTPDSLNIPVPKADTPATSKQ